MDTARLEGLLEQYLGKAKRVVVVTDGVFSMRGDYAPLDVICAICRRYSELFEEGVISVVDDSHGVGAFGETGRGTEEKTAARADILIATLGKALGVNGGYVVADRTVIDSCGKPLPSTFTPIRLLLRKRRRPCGAGNTRQRRGNRSAEKNPGPCRLPAPGFSGLAAAKPWTANTPSFPS